MAGFSELIKNFDKTRDYVRDFFIYGYKVRGEVGSKSARTYDNEKRRVESWLKGYITSCNTDRGKQMYISVDSGHIYENPLYNAFYSKSFTDNDIKLHFMIADILQECSQLTAREVTERINDSYNELFDEQTVRGKLREYADEGILAYKKQGKSVLFSLADDCTADSFSGIEGLTDAVSYFSENAPFGVVGNSILKAFNKNNTIFLKKHNYIVHTLEDEILKSLLDAIEDRYKVLIENDNGNGRMLTSGIPLKIYVSAASGRRYLIIYAEKLRRFQSFRLDSIKTIKLLDKCDDDFDKYAEKLADNERYVYGVSFGDRRDEDCRRGIVKITFHIDEQREKFVLERLEREKRSGRIEKTGENLFTYYGDYFDANEMMVWVKSFIGRIVSIEGTSETLESRFKRDIVRMNRMYSRAEEESE